MLINLKIVPVLLIATLAAIVTANFWAGQHLSASVQLPEPSSGCHGHGNGHGGTNPRQGPVHDCCLTGHDAAIPQLSSADRPPANCHRPGGLASAPSPTIAITGLVKHSPIASSESPGTTPLRI
jgi:hypothetical protein